MLDMRKNPQNAVRKMVLYKIGSVKLSHASEILYNVWTSKTPLGVGENLELIEMLCRNLAMASCAMISQFKI